jgi:hypothetical protein
MRSDKGLSSAAMRPPAILFALLLALSLAALVGCSTRQDRLLSNRRLLRGPAGFGGTTRVVLNPDRDTYVGTSKSFFSPTLLVGVDGPLDAQSYFSTSAWTLPPTTVPQDSIESVEVVIPVDSLSDRPASSLLGLSINAGAFDSTQAWGTPPPEGPTPGLTLAQFDVATVGPLRFSLPLTYYTDSLLVWKANPAAFPGFAVISLSRDALVELDPRAAYVQVSYFNRAATGKATPDTVRTALTRHFTTRSPLSPAPTGSEPTLVLGGNFNTGLLVHFPPVVVPEGSTVNEATLRLRLDPATQPFATGDTVRIYVQRVDSTWAESEVSRDPLKLDTSTLLGVRSAVTVGALDSVVAVALPPSIIRYWAEPGAVNEGILVMVAQPYYTPPILVRSRETSLPIELRVSYTSPPPARF